MTIDSRCRRREDQHRVVDIALGHSTALFFRYDTAARIIIFAWVNDASTLRTHGTKTDAYAVFRSMLAKGDPPDDWHALVAAARTLEVGGLSVMDEDKS